MLRAFGHHVAMCCDVLGVVGSSLKTAKFQPTTPNMSQHVATCRNRVAKRTQHVAPNNVAICCVAMLRLFGRGFRRSIFNIYEAYLDCCCGKFNFNCMIYASSLLFMSSKTFLNNCQGVVYIFRSFV